MAWTTPSNATVSQILTAARWNSDVRDNFRYLKGLDGAPTIDNDLNVVNTVNPASINAFTTFTGGYGSGRIQLGDSTNVVRAQIWGQRNSTNAGGFLLFQTKNDSGNLLEALRIDQNQNVGIGTTAPVARFHVAQSGASGMFVGASGVTGTTTLLAAGSVPNIVGYHGIVYATDGTANNITPGAVRKSGGPGILYAGEFQINPPAADGSLTVQRIGGTRSWSIAFWLTIL